jgi:hypothetical protein
MPTPSPWDSISVDDERDALHQISTMMVGTKMLQDEPGVVYSLAAQQAHPADAQAIDQFMQELDAEKQVKLARAAGEQIHLDSSQQRLLDNQGVQYGDVLYTRQDASQEAAQKILEASHGKVAAKFNDDGTVAVDENGNIVTVPVEKAHKSGGGGLFSSIGGFFGHVGHDLKNWAYEDTLKPVLHKINQGYNLVQSGFHSPIQEPNLGDIAHGNLNVKIDHTSYEDMQAQGYDPNSIWSQLAFDASGRKHTDLSSLVDSYGQDKVNTALEFLNDPKSFREKIEQDPNSYIKTADGQTQLTADAKARLEYLASDDFSTLARKINAHQATIGNDLANAIGLDPIHHATTYNITAAASNIAASFALDPTLISLNMAKTAKLSQIGIDTLGDADGAAAILTRNGRYAKQVQRGWQRGIDLAAQMREADAAGDTVKLAKLTGQFNAELPALAPLMPEFVGKYALQGWRNPTELERAQGAKGAIPVMGETGGIRSLEDAADFVKNKWGLNLLMNGRAATQASRMPGALSAVGWRKFKGATAGWMSARSAARAEKVNAQAVSRLEADPLKAGKWVDEGLLLRMSPEADDAVDTASEKVIAEKATDDGGLASQQRAERQAYELTYAGKGQVARNLRTKGDVLGDATALGWASPTAIAARSRLAAQRFSTLLPRNTAIDVNDAASGDKLYKMALTYLNRGDAQALRAAWNFGDGGQRKAIIGGLVDQLGHAAGLGKSASGAAWLNKAKTAEQAYSAAGSDIILDGQPISLLEGQTRQVFTLPSFRELQLASAKLGLWESTIGRPLTASQTDSLMAGWKMGLLLKPSTITRNQLEGWLRTVLDGKAGTAVRAKALATARNKDLWDRGYNLNSPLHVEYQLAVEAGDTARAKAIAQGSMLSGDILGRSATGTKLSNLAPMAWVGRAYRSLVGSHMDAELVDALYTLSPEELTEAMEGYGQQLLASDLGFKNAAREATEVAKAGYGPAKIRYAVHRAVSRQHGKAADEHISWTHQALDGTVGAGRYATALGQRVNANPETTRAVLDYIEDPKVGLDPIIKAMEKEKKNTAFGTVYFEDPIGAPNVARRAVTTAEAETGKRDWAQKLVDEYAYLLTGQNGKFQKELADEIRRTGKAPSADWIADHVTGDHRPPSALAPEVMAMPVGGTKSLPQTLQDVSGGAYQWMVERPLQRTTSSPVFLANYAIARKGLNPQVEQMVEAGISRESAEALAKDLSIRNAWVKTEQMIDDPGQKTQFDVIARNMFPFARATQAMIRRWGTGLWQNPTAARKMMLAYEGAVHSGLIYTNSYGEPVFTYPGSGVMNMAMREVSKIPGMSGVAQFPTSASMTGGVLMSVPGADNPFRMSMGPMLTMPLRAMYEHLFPAIGLSSLQDPAAKVDEFINGPVGQGEIFMQLLPTVARKFYANVMADDRNSALASSMNGAFANLAAAGLIPPPDASPAELQQFRGRLQTQVRNHLYLRFALGLFAPAAPSAPEEGTGASGADYAWSIDGVKGLSDEYKSILDETGGDVGRANAIFTALHPDEVVYSDHGEPVTKLPAAAYETAKSKMTANGSYVPSTDSALRWMTTNADFIKKYSSVAAYFMPNESTGEPFSDAAYRTQIELGLRQRKTPEEFMSDVYVKHAESAFYPSAAEFDKRIALAHAQGDSAQEAAMTQAKSDWEKHFEDLNQLFGNKMRDYGTARSKALGQLADLRHMMQEGDVPSDAATKLRQLVTAYDNYESFIRSRPGSDKVTKAQHKAALDTFNKWAEQTLTGSPVNDVFNGVFRVLNSNFDKIG